MWNDLQREDRLRLVRFVCSFVWADLHVEEKERAFVRKLVRKLGLQDDAQEVEKWLRVPPRPEEVDPAQIPPAHKKLFLDAARDAIAADGQIDPEERESFKLLEQLIR